MTSGRMNVLRPFNGFPRSTDAGKGYIVKYCRGCGERIFIPFNQLGERPQVCSSCYT